MAVCDTHMPGDDIYFAPALEPFRLNIIETAANIIGIGRWLILRFNIISNLKINRSLTLIFCQIYLAKNC